MVLVSCKALWVRQLTGTQSLQGVMTAPQGAGQVPLRTASEQQEVVHALLTTSQLIITELYCDNTMTLQRHADRTEEGKEKTERDKKKRHVYNMKWAHII